MGVPDPSPNDEVSMTLFQEPYPHKARTFASTAEAFPCSTHYAAAIQRFPKNTLWRRFCRLLWGHPWKFEQ
jgi:hypothetical protein